MRTQRPPTEKVLRFSMSFPDSVKKMFFQNIKIKFVSPKIIKFKNLQDSEVYSCDFPGLKTSLASFTSAASATSLASTASKVHFPPKNYLILMV